MILTIKSPQVRRSLSRYFDLPEQPNDGRAATFGPYKRGEATLYWHYRGNDAWEVEEIEGRSLEEYSRLRERVSRLAEEYRDQMPPEKLVALLIQACIETGLARRADIMDSVEFATMFDAIIIDRVLTRHRGRDPSRHLWWVDDKRAYRLH